MQKRNSEIAARREGQGGTDVLKKQSMTTEEKIMDGDACVEVLQERLTWPWGRIVSKRFRADQKKEGSPVWDDDK